MKRCIFHYPQPIEDKPGVGSALRPNKMRAAFENIGYQVDVISGNSTERSRKIKEIRKKIKNGVHYDFLYSESVNTPTVLADEDHIPRHPFSDFSFLNFCRKQGIPVGLFYRDVHWKFPVYKSVAIWKRMILLPLFRYDLHMYHKVVDVLYLPSERMGEVVSGYYSIPLPPGGSSRPDVLVRRQEKAREPDKLHVFYVGNVLGVYDVTAFCKAVSECENVYLTLCTPQKSWEQAQERYLPYMCDRIQVVHKTSDQLQQYYEEADVFCCCLEANDYTCLAMPIKVFESISYGVPVMMTQGIAAGQLISKEDCGWVVENKASAFKELLLYLRDNPEDVWVKTKNTLAIAQKHTWECRAQQVADDLTGITKKERSS